MPTILLMAGFILWALAYVCDAVMDTVMFHQTTMIFKGVYWRVDPFYHRRPWYKKIGGDAWHDFKKLKQLAVVAALSCFAASGYKFYEFLPPLPLITYIVHEYFLHKVFERG